MACQSKPVVRSTTDPAPSRMGVRRDPSARIVQARLQFGGLPVDYTSSGSGSPPSSRYCGRPCGSIIVVVLASMPRLLKTVAKMSW